MPRVPTQDALHDPKFSDICAFKKRNTARTDCEARLYNQQIVQKSRQNVYGRAGVVLRRPNPRRRWCRNHCKYPIKGISGIFLLIYRFYRVQSDKLQSLISAAKVEGVEPIWTQIFAKVHSILKST